MAEEAKNSSAAHAAEIEALKRQIEEMNKRLEELSAATNAGVPAEGDSSALAASAEAAEVVEPAISSEAPVADSGTTGSFVAETNASAVEAVPAPVSSASAAASEAFEAFPNTPPIEKVVDDDGNRSIPPMSRLPLPISCPRRSLPSRRLLSSMAFPMGSKVRCRSSLPASRSNPMRSLVMPLSNLMLSSRVKQRTIRKAMAIMRRAKAPIRFRTSSRSCIRKTMLPQACLRFSWACSVCISFIWAITPRVSLCWA